MSYELLIQHGSNIMYPPTVEGVTIEWERKGQPGKLTFEVVKTPGLSFQEGDPCRFSVDGTPVFYGFVFEKSRKGNNPNVIKCVVYDQLYYLKNKDTYFSTVLPEHEQHQQRRLLEHQWQCQQQQLHQHQRVPPRSDGKA